MIIIQLRLLLLLLLSRFSRVRLCATPGSHPWASPGKNTGVGCHFLLQCRKVKSESEVAQSCPTPSDPMDCSLPGSSVHGTFQARVLEWGATAFSEKYANERETLNRSLQDKAEEISRSRGPIKRNSKIIGLNPGNSISNF